MEPGICWCTCCTVEISLWDFRLWGAPPPKLLESFVKCKYAKKIIHMMCTRRIRSKPEGLCQSMQQSFDSSSWFLCMLFIPLRNTTPMWCPLFHVAGHSVSISLFLAICQRKTFAVGVRFSCSIHVFFLKLIILIPWLQSFHSKAWTLSKV